MFTSRLIYKFTYNQQEKQLLDEARNSPDTAETIAKMEAMLKLKTKIDIRDIRIKNEINFIGYYYTPLMWSVHHGHINKVKFLIAKGANLTCKTKKNNNILHLAVREGHTDIVALLIKLYPESLRMKGENNLTPYELALQKWNKNIIRLLNPNFDFRFPASEVLIPFELITKILLLLNNDINTFKSLSLVNTEWNTLMNQQGRCIYEKNFRDYLPKDLKEKPWLEVFHHYYPHHKPPKDPFRELLQHFQTFYLQGPEISLLQKTNFIESVGLAFQMFKDAAKYDPQDTSGDKVGILLLGLLLHVTGHLDFAFKKKNVSSREITKSSELQTASTVKLYRELVKISDDEFAEAQKDLHYEDREKTKIQYHDKDNKVMYSTRRPVFEVMVKPDAALQSLNNPNAFFDLPAEEIQHVNNYRFPQNNEEIKDSQWKL